MRRLLCLGLLSACFPGAEEPTDAVLSIMVQPEATVYINGKDEGSVTIRNFEGLEPGQYEVRLTAEGYEPFTTSLALEAGETSRVQQELVAIVPEADASTPTMRFDTTPPGATVTVNGEELGVTPIEGWTPTNEVLEIALALDGHKPHTETLSEPVAEYAHTMIPLVKRAPVRRVKKAAEPGFVSIGIVGGGWAHVYVDGEKLKKTAPLAKYELSAGPHAIRVVNEGIGLDWSRDITIASGKVMKLAAKPN